MSRGSSFEDFFESKRRDIFDLKRSIKKQNTERRAALQEQLERRIEKEKSRIERIERINYENECRDIINSKKLELVEECMVMLMNEYNLNENPVLLVKLRKEVVHYINKNFNINKEDLKG